MSKGRLIVAGVVLASAGVMAFLGNWEGANQQKVYADKLARGLPTVCKGLTKHITTTPIIVGEVWSKAKCEDEERRAVIKVQRELLPCFDLIPPQSVFDAATSHAWNVGAPKTCGSAAMRAWNQGQWALGCRRLAFSDSGKSVWSYANGRFVQGLQNRRKAERAMCEAGI